MAKNSIVDKPNYAAIRKFTKSDLVLAFKRFYSMQYHDLCGVYTRQRIELELRALLAELKRRRINVRVEREITIKVPLCNYLVKGAKSLENVTIF